MKKVLIAYYSQSGQIKEVLDEFIRPFVGDHEYELVYHQIKPVNDFPFPWSSEVFFDAFPESVTETGCKLQAMPVDLKQSYDLIVLGLQVWYLSPSIPITAFLQSDDFKGVAKDTNLVTINACRNMWTQSQEVVVEYIKQAKANYIGHLVLFDRTNNFTSVLTIMYWAFTGKKDQMWGFMPKPGVMDKDIKGMQTYGKILKEYWQTNQLEDLQSAYIKSNGIIIKPYLMSMEQKGKRIFKIWSKIILKKGGPGNPKRVFSLKLFKYYLLIMIYLVSPIVTLGFFITYPLFYRRIQRKIIRYQSVDAKAYI
ncbi:MAG: hypothetical protein KAH25_04025 [Bacteroidales bacterium]|nr:hypothetical protein [Bacteroidales bacterium]